MTNIMLGVAKFGTASNVGFPASLDVAVKTGTAQTSPTAPEAVANVDWMIGFAPANDPVVAVAVVVPEQSKSSDGAGVAGPIMKAMLETAVAHSSIGGATTTTRPASAGRTPLVTTTTAAAPGLTTTTTTAAATTTVAPRVDHGSSAGLDHDG